MSEPTKELLTLFRFRVLLEFHPEYACFVAQCLETGNIVTADDIDTAQSMIVELLEDEVEFAIEHKNVRNLTSSPSSILIWKRWTDSIREGSEIIKKHFSNERTSIGRIDTQLELVIQISHEKVEGRAAHSTGKGGQ